MGRTNGAQNAKYQVVVANLDGGLKNVNAVSEKVAPLLRVNSAHHIRGDKGREVIKVVHHGEHIGGLLLDINKYKYIL